MKDILALW